LLGALFRLLFQNFDLSPQAGEQGRRILIFPAK
jgi:hypothetical protein